MAEQLSFASPAKLSRPKLQYHTDDTPAQSLCPSCCQPFPPTYDVTISNVMSLFVRLGAEGGIRALLGNLSPSGCVSGLRSTCSHCSIRDFDFGDPSLDGHRVKEDRYVSNHPASAGEGLQSLETWEAPPFKILKVNSSCHDEPWLTMAGS